MRILTWNIKQGGRQDLTNKIVNTLINHDPDIIVLTEYRENRGTEIRNNLKSGGWNCQFTSSVNEKDNSILIASKENFRRLPKNRFRPKATHRWLKCIVPTVNLIILGIHIPGAMDKWDKEDFWKSVIHFSKRNRNSDALIIGDFNTGLPIDAEGAPFQLSEYMCKLIGMGWVDAWRFKYPYKSEFTWYSPKKRNGFRLDYAFLSPTLKERLVRVFHSHTEREKGLSDHSSLVIELDLSKKSKFNIGF